MSLRLLTLIALFVCAFSGMRAEEKTSTLTFKAKCGGSGTADDGVVWTITSDGLESAYDSTKGIHYGTGSSAVGYITLTTSDIPGTIKKVVVNASTANDVKNATVGVTVGAEAFGGNAQPITSTATDYTFEGGAQGSIVVTIKKPSKATKALYCKKIIVTYDETANPSCSAPTFSPASGIYTSAQTVTITTATDGATIYYTTDGTDPTEASAPYTDPITVSETTTIKAIAVAEGYDNSAVASATYTITQPSTIADVREQATGDVFTNGIVTSVNGKNAYIQDATAAILVFGSSTITDLEVGDEITVSGSLTTYHGLLEIQNPVYQKVSTGNTVTPEVMTIAQILASDKQGWLVKIEETTVTAIDNQNVTIAQGDNAIVVRFNTAPSDFAVNDKLTLTGNIGCYDAVQIANPTDITIATATVAQPTFSPAAGTYTEAQTVTIACETEGATIYYTTDGTEPTAVSTEYTAPINVSQTTTIKAIAIKGTDESAVAQATYHINSLTNPYTVAQALAFNEYPVNGVYVHGIVSTAPTKDPTNDGEMTYFISDDGEANSQLEVYKGKGLEQAAFSSKDDIQLGDIVTIYGNVQDYNGTIEFATGNYLVSFVRPPSITLAESSKTIDATLPEGQSYNTASIELTLNNCGGAVLQIAYCDAEGNIVTSNPYNSWITVDINEYEGKYYVSGHAFESNTGDARTAYAKVYVTVDGVNYYSDLVSFTQLDPTVTFELGETNMSFPAEIVGGQADMRASFIVTINNYSGDDEGVNVAYCDAEGNILTPSPYTWITIAAKKIGVTGIVFQNNTEETPRTAYAKIYVTVNGVNYYSDLFSFTQEGYVAPSIAELPFEWEGGSSEDLLALNGITANGLGTDYAASNAPYLVKLDGTGDYIQVQTNERPGIVTIDVKMLGGGNTSTITVQESADGETFTDVQALTISGSQNSTLTLATTTEFAESSRYVRLLFTKGSNVGVGPITIAQYEDIVLEDYTLSIAESENVTITANYGEEVLNNGENADITQGTEITLAITPAEGYDLASLTITGAEEGQTVTPVASSTTAGVYTFTMPAFAVTVTATVVEHVEPVLASYVLATSITSGKRYVIASETTEGKVQVMAEQKSNNRGAIEATIDTDGKLSVSDEYEFVIESATIGAVTGYSIFDEGDNGYLYAAGSDSNYLRTQADNDANGIWAITFGEGGVASIVAESSSNRNVMQYNGTNKLFSCYATASQSPVYLYEKVETPPTRPGDVNHDGDVTIADVTALVNIILGKDTEGVYDHEAADVNGDEGITIADVTALVNIILGKN